MSKYAPGSYRDIHFERHIKALHERTAAWAAQGLCRSCGREAEPDRKHCAEHLRYFRQYQRERRQRLRAERRRREQAQ